MDRQQRLERLHRISSLFDKALERDPGEWSAFLLSECPDDPEIRQKVQDLLVSFQGPDDPRGTAGSDLLPDVDGLSEDKPIHMVGRRIGPYWIKRLIADGNASVVFEALNTETNAPVALRVLRSAVASNRAAMRRLTSDTSVLNRLDDSRFVHTRDIRTEEGATVVVSDLAEGLPLSDFLRANGAFSEDAARPIFRQLVETLQAAHKRGIVHRDLQASDVFLKPAGPDQWTIQVTGFGLARMPSHAQLGNQTLGSGQRVAYLSPEHLTAHSSVDRRSDLYAAGMILCEMLGQPLVSSSDSADVVRKQVLAGFDEGDLPETQDDLRLILARLLALDPAQRFQSAGDVLAALGRAQDTEPIRPAAPTPPRPRAPKPTSAAPPRPGASARPSPMKPTVIADGEVAGDGVPADAISSDEPAPMEAYFVDESKLAPPDAARQEPDLAEESPSTEDELDEAVAETERPPVEAEESEEAEPADLEPAAVLAPAPDVDAPDVDTPEEELTEPVEERPDDVEDMEPAFAEVEEADEDDVAHSAENLADTETDTKTDTQTDEDEPAFAAAPVVDTSDRAAIPPASASLDEDLPSERDRRPVWIWLAPLLLFGLIGLLMWTQSGTDDAEPDTAQADQPAAPTEDLASATRSAEDLAAEDLAAEELGEAGTDENEPSDTDITTDEVEGELSELDEEATSDDEPSDDAGEATDNGGFDLVEDPLAGSASGSSEDTDSAPASTSETADAGPTAEQPTDDPIPPADDAASAEPVATSSAPEPVGGFGAIQQQATYPRSARGLGIEGVVTVEVSVDENGAITGTRVIDSIGFVFDQEATRVIRGAQFYPALADGNPVAGTVRIPIRFEQ